MIFLFRKTLDSPDYVGHFKTLRELRRHMKLEIESFKTVYPKERYSTKDYIIAKELK